MFAEENYRINLYPKVIVLLHYLFVRITVRQCVLALIVDIYYIVNVDPSEHVIIVDKEGQIESEIDQGPEHLNQGFNSIKVKIYSGTHRFSSQEEKVPDLVCDVVCILQERRDQTALVQQPRQLLEVEEEARDDVEYVD